MEAEKERIESMQQGKFETLAKMVFEIKAQINNVGNLTFL